MRPFAGLALASGSFLLSCAEPVAPESAPPAQGPPSVVASAAVVPSAPVAASSPSAPASLLPTPESLPEGTPTQRAALNRAKVSLLAGRDREALAGFRQAMEGGMTGTSVSAALATAELLVAKGREAEALELYQQLVERARLIPEVQYAAGRFFWERGDDAAAQRALETALLVQGDFLPAWRLLGMAQARAGKKTEAGRTLTEYELRLGRLARRAGDLARTAGDRLSALQLLSMLDDERAVSALVDALKDPERGVRTAMADILAEEEDPAALVALAGAALSEQDPDVRLHLADALARARLRARAETATPLPALPRPGTAPGTAAP